MVKSFYVFNENCKTTDNKILGYDDGGQGGL